MTFLLNVRVWLETYVLDTVPIFVLSIIYLTSEAENPDAGHRKSL